MTRTAPAPDAPWTPGKPQLTGAQEPNLYGGFIHPWSSTKANDLHLMVSKWTRGADGRSTAYHVSQFVGTL